MLKKLLVAACLVLSSSAAFADDDGVYVGFDIGNTRSDNFLDNYASMGVFAGYKLNSQLSFEIAHRRLLSFNFFGIDVDMKQTSLSGLGSINVAKDFDLYGRLGYNKLSATQSYRGRQGSASDSGILVGLGAAYHFNKNFSARLEVQKPNSDARNVAASMLFKF